MTLNEAWEKATEDFKELEDDNNYSYRDENIDELIAKTRERNKDNYPANIVQKKLAKSSPSDFKLKKGVSLGLDRSTDKKLKAGKIHIDLRIDLHGLNLEDAYFKLKDTIDYGFEEGYRLILAITGKGSHSAKGEQTIKSSLQNWLSQPELSSKIIKYVDAHRRHGGRGAVYVLLRRHR